VSPGFFTARRRCGRGNFSRCGSGARGFRAVAARGHGELLENSAGICKAGWVIVALRKDFYLTSMKKWLNVVDNTVDAGLFLSVPVDLKFCEFSKILR
jgi:hypothetical protein